MKDFKEFFTDNLVYCGDTHSFVHRLYDYIMKEKPESHKQAQYKAFEIIDEMLEERKK